MGKLKDKRATIKDIAALAQVSHPTVSRVLNNNLDGFPLRPETIERIRKAARELNYRPNRAAQFLKNQRTRIIGVSVANNPHHQMPLPASDPSRYDPSTINWVLAEMLLCISTVCWAHGYDCLMLQRREETDGRMNREDLYPDSVDGLIYLSPSFRHQEYLEVAQAGFPLVLVGYCPPDVAIHSCDIDNEGAMEELTRHLIEAGVRNPLYVFSASPDWVAAKPRFSTFQRVLAEAGASCDPGNVWQNEELGDEMRDWMHDRLNEDRSIDGILFATWQAHRSVLQVLDERRLRVPQQMKVAGICDGYRHEAEAFELTCMHLPLGSVTQTAAKMMIDQLGGRLTEVEHKQVPAQLIIRSSTQPKPTN